MDVFLIILEFLYYLILRHILFIFQAYYVIKSISKVCSVMIWILTNFMILTIIRWLKIRIPIKSFGDYKKVQFILAYACWKEKMKNSIIILNINHFLYLMLSFYSKVKINHNSIKCKNIYIFLNILILCSPYYLSTPTHKITVSNTGWCISINTCFW